MARRCALSNVGPLAGNNRSHAMNATRRTWKINTRKIWLDGKKVTVSIRSYRTLKKIARQTNQTSAPEVTAVA